MSAVRTMPKIRNRDMGYLCAMAHENGCSRRTVKVLGAMSQKRFDAWKPRMVEIVRNGGANLKPPLEDFEREFREAIHLCVLRAIKRGELGRTHFLPEPGKRRFEKCQKQKS